MLIPRTTAALLAAALFHSAQAQDCRFRDLGHLGTPGTWITDISEDGRTIVGYSRTAAGLTHAFRWTPSEGMRDLDVPNGPGSDAAAVNPDGTVIVGTMLVAGSARAFRWTAETGMQPIGTLGGNFSAAIGVSADGSIIVGDSRNADNEPRYFRWSEETGMHDLGIGPAMYLTQAQDVDATGYTLVGSRGDYPDQMRAFRHHPFQGLEDLGTLGGSVSNGNGVADDGELVVGWSRAENGRDYAFTWRRDEGMLALPLLPNTSFDYAFGVTDDGLWAAGNAWPNVGQPRMVRWNLQDRTVQDLGRHSRNTQTNVLGVADEGRVLTGYLFYEGAQHAFRWTIAADLNNDAFLDMFDVLDFFDAFEAGSRRADLNHDDFLDFFDVLDFLDAFEAGC